MLTSWRFQSVSTRSGSAQPVNQAALECGSIQYFAEALLGSVMLAVEEHVPEQLRTSVGVLR